MGKGINIIHVNCDPSAADDKSLPRDSYLVTYGDNNEQKHDIVQGLQSDIFDHLLAILPEFGLRVYQRPSGMDIRALSAVLPGRLENSGQ